MLHQDKNNEFFFHSNLCHQTLLKYAVNKIYFGLNVKNSQNLHDILYCTKNWQDKNHCSSKSDLELEK